MYFIKAIAVLAAALVPLAATQQYAGDVILNSLPSVPGSEIAYFRINDPSGKNKKLTLINYYSHGKTTTKRLVESNVQRAVVIIHGLNRDPGTYMSNMLSALAQVKSDPNVNFDTVAIMAPYFPNGDDKGTGYPWTDGLSAGKGSTSNALVWKGSQWSAGANNQYPYNSKNTSSYAVLDQIVQYFDDMTLFPKMQQIVIAGHSLGAQTVQRYAAIGTQLNTKSPVSYWVGNPNSYAWMSTDRPFPTAGCSDYDEYRDGYSKFEDYPMTYGVDLVSSGRAAILANYNSRAINYGRGTQDYGDSSSGCAPGTNGKDRNERFFNFIKAFPATCPDPAGRNCDTVDFVNTGHDGGAMMASEAGRARLFLDNFYGNGNRSYDFGYPRQQTGDDPYPNPALNGTTASVNNNTYAGNMTYWGCWSDQNPQTLTNLTYQSNANTIELCTRTCAAGGNTVAGMENGNQCFCGSSLGYRAQQVVESSCASTCPANSSQTCGGFNRLSLFSNGRPQLQPTPGTPENVGAFTYISCYTEASSGRALAAQGTSSNKMTLEYCADYCSGYRYFGTEYGSECYCGNSFAAGASRTNDDECSMLCANDNSQFCGAGNRLTVYQNPGWTGPSSVSSIAGASATSPGSSQGTTVSCPASDGTIITSGGNSFTIECGIDHQAGDLTSLSVSSFQQCIDACAQNGKCVDVSLSGAACYLKSVLGAAIQNGGIWGAKLVTDVSSAAPSATTSSTAESSPSVRSSSSSVEMTSTNDNSPTETSTSRSISSMTSVAVPTSSSSTSSQSSATSVSSSSRSSTSIESLSSSSTAAPSTQTSASSASSTSQSTTLSTRTTSLSSSSSSATPTGYRSLGCYAEPPNRRLLPTSNGASILQTPQLCARACSTRGFKYSGTEYASECWCGNTLPDAPLPVPASQCSMKCSGDRTQTCGAGNRLSVVVDQSWKQTFFARESYEDWNLMGCYVDSVSKRTLKSAISLAASGGIANATIANCLEACRAKGYTYCGEEYYSECFGSMTPPVASVASGADALAAGCNYPCNGNKTEACGGSDRILVYTNVGTLG